jgi:hypothetical protein
MLSFAAHILPHGNSIVDGNKPVRAKAKKRRFRRTAELPETPAFKSEGYIKQWN